jgi:hypothetical protein
VDAYRTSPEYGVDRGSVGEVVIEEFIVGICDGELVQVGIWVAAGVNFGARVVVLVARTVVAVDDFERLVGNWVGNICV